jgi:hypothetical protein
LSFETERNGAGNGVNIGSETAVTAIYGFYPEFWIEK